MNLASSRSHCIFTVHVEARKAGEEMVRKAKVHLVDLAGSERVSKTGVDGVILREAGFINGSLLFLEQVIIISFIIIIIIIIAILIINNIINNIITIHHHH